MSSPSPGDPGWTAAPREQLMKHLGLFEKDNRQQPPGAVVHPPGVRIEFTPILKTRKG
jgi:hypothetical protein